MDALQLEIPWQKTMEYFKSTEATDLRDLANINPKFTFEFDSYYQLFNEKQGFILNLSILDLIFMEGPNALNYLESQTLPF